MRVVVSSPENFLSQTTNVCEIPETANAAIFATYTSDEQAIEDVCYYIDNNLSDIIQLPELFFVADKSVTKGATERQRIENLSLQCVKEVSNQLRPFQYVCTSLILNEQHQAVLISNAGVFAKQPQLQCCERYYWTTLGEALNVIALPLEQGSINVAMLTGDDAQSSDYAKLASENDTHALLVPFDVQEPMSIETNLIKIAHDHRICVVAATREKTMTYEEQVEQQQNGNMKTPKTGTSVGVNVAVPEKVSDENGGNKKKVKLQKSTGFIANLPTAEMIERFSKSRKFVGEPSGLIVKHQHGKITKALIHPAATCSKLQK